MEENIISKWLFKYGNEIIRKKTEEKLERLMKQETIEESALNYALEQHKLSKDVYVQDFYRGANWQAERMYSEEELREAFNQGQENIDYHEIHGFSAKLTINEWFEQFKKEKAL
jgi:hypothetical protein